MSAQSRQEAGGGWSSQALGELWPGLALFARPEIFCIGISQVFYNGKLKKKNKEKKYLHQESGKTGQKENTSTATPGEKSEAVKHSILTAQKESIDYF